MIKIGLTGSIAMGKSEVAKLLQAEGVPVFDADREVHRLYDSPAGANIVGTLAPGAVVARKVDRRLLTEAVLADQNLLQKLEAKVHAEIRKRRDAFFRDQAAQGLAMAAADIPLLFETGSETEFDATIVVSARADIQNARAMARPGMTEEKLKMILARQMPDSDKRKRARHVIENNGTLEELRTKTQSVIRDIRKEHAL